MLRGGQPPTETSFAGDDGTSTSSPFARQPYSPNMALTSTYAALYVLSGCSQPMLMTLCKNAGLADSTTQIYMMFYYLGPALVILPLLLRWDKSAPHQDPWPPFNIMLKACGIALWDIVSATLNYTGAGLAGPTIFAIVYSSVTIWTAIFSYFCLQRQMNIWQWLAVCIVFGGLTLTTTDSLDLGHDVVKGLVLVLVGSMMHALAYVMSESIMTLGPTPLSIQHNCAFQGIVAFTCFLVWQLVYTLPRFTEKILQPMQEANTTISIALTILLSFAMANLVHALTYFHTLRHYPGGATSAGVMKGLQAVLVFVFTDLIYCGRLGGEEMCFTRGKFLSLVTVTSGVIGYGIATELQQRTSSSTSSIPSRNKADYEHINDVTITMITDQGVEIEPLNK